MTLPKNLRFSEYLWVKADGDIATIGVTDYALAQTKEIVFIDLPREGNIKKGTTLFSLESAKWSGHIASPVSGNVADVNDSLFDEPEKLNKSPYESWVCKIKLADVAELAQLMDAEAAAKWVDCL
jgi:glycine cleavage system H protein